jgi:soluble epoxide hydrolase / lipid-phosphate phosphatase
LIQKPVFYGSSSRDYFAFAEQSYGFTFQAIGSNGSLTTHEYNTGHWVMLEAKDEVNNDLLQWIEGLELSN